MSVQPRNGNAAAENARSGTQRSCTIYQKVRLKQRYGNTFWAQVDKFPSDRLPNEGKKIFLDKRYIGDYGGLNKASITVAVVNLARFNVISYVSEIPSIFKAYAHP